MTFPYHQLVITLACEAAGVTVEDLLSPSREQALFEVRCIISYLLRSKGHKLIDIAQALNRTHAAVIHQFRTCEKRIKLYPYFRRKMEKVLIQLKKDEYKD